MVRRAKNSKKENVISIAEIAQEYQLVLASLERAVQHARGVYRILRCAVDSMGRPVTLAVAKAQAVLDEEIDVRY